MNIFKRSIFTCCMFLMAAQVNGQALSAKLKDFLTGPLPSSFNMQYTEEVKEFYVLNGYQFTWFSERDKANFESLSAFVSNAATLGLNANDYQPSVFNAQQFDSAKNETDSILIEIKLTDAAIHFIHDLLMGNKAEPLGYNGIKIPDTCFNIPAVLNRYILYNRFAFLLAELEPKQPEYLAVKALLNRFQNSTAAPGFKDAEVISAKADNSNKALLNRLYQLGITGSDTIALEVKILQEKIKEVQSMFSLLADGTLRSTTRHAFNIPLATRIRELMFALNSLRRLYCIKQSRHIVVVNIPSASLLVYERGKVVLESRLIVGKKSTPTPTLSSTITEVILYPYWNVPYKIASRELLPLIKRNPGYLDANNYQVLNMNGKVMNPKDINWHSLSSKYFPYVIRQSTGCDNALGLIKLNFYNPFTVYLHDTPGKNLFALNKRYFSHGCMRTEKAMELGRYILQDNSIAIDTLTAKGCLRNQAPIVVPAKEQIPVFVLYHTAWIDAALHVRFYEDIYQKLVKAN